MKARPMKKSCLFFLSIITLFGWSRAYAQTAATDTPTATPTNTATNSSTATASPVPNTIQVSLGSSPNLFMAPGASNVLVMQVLINNPNSSQVTLESLGVTVSGTGSPDSGIASLVLSKNGTTLASSTTSVGDANFNFIDVLGPSASVTYQMNANFQASAPTGTYLF